MVIKDSIGGWKNNAYNYQSKKAFTTFKNFFGTEWPKFYNSFHMKESKSGILPVNCRLINTFFHYIIIQRIYFQGVYVTDGYSTSDIASNGNFPKTFFYGTYQFILDYLDTSGNADGCMSYVIELKRPWELE